MLNFSNIKANRFKLKKTVSHPRKSKFLYYACVALCRSHMCECRFSLCTGISFAECSGAALSWETHDKNSLAQWESQLDKLRTY